MAKTVYRFRIKDKHGAELCRQARAVSFVWNWCQDAQLNALRWNKKWPSGFDLSNLAAGASKELGLLATTINTVCIQYAQSRLQHKRRTLRWRGAKSLGWIPARDKTIRFDGEAFAFGGVRYFAWLTRPLEKGQTFGVSSFSQDSRGRWYINLLVKDAPTAPSPGWSSVGIDLGLKDLIATSAGEKVEAPRWFRKQQERIATAQRACKKRQVRSLRAGVANRRADHLHKLSHRLVQEHGAIFVGNVNSAKLAKTKMAKSVLDAGWSE